MTYRRPLHRSDRRHLAKLAEAIFIAEDVDNKPCGFLELSIRSYAEGCSSSAVPFIEGWFVAPHARHKGAGRLLAQAAEHWAVMRNFTEIASDTELENAQSQAVHAALGYEEVERLVTYRKSLRV
ncbi:MAG: GNAT family N-acetyltransferase [Hyphomonadaceae bacterium]|nr:GNAT family N-acetyltransferase [Hyphomonadaceae bacterium]